MPGPADTPSAVSTASPAAAPATLVHLSLDRTRPDQLAADVPLLGRLPAYPILEAAWSPDGTLLAYSYDKGGAGRLEVLRPADASLLSRWTSPGWFSDLRWTPDGDELLFLTESGTDRQGAPAVQLGAGHPGQAGWRVVYDGLHSDDLLDQWLDDRTLLVWTNCGTVCLFPSVLDIRTGQRERENYVWDNPPDAHVMTVRFLFSADRRWFAATDDGLRARTVVGRWDRRDEPGAMAPLTAGLNTRYTDAQFWSGHTLVFMAYPPGEFDQWPEPALLDLRLWNPDTGERRLLARGALGVYRLPTAFINPTGNLVALLMAGQPRVGADGVLEAQPSGRQLVLVRWPEWELVASCPAGRGPHYSTCDRNDRAVVWSPDGSALVFQPAQGGLAWMDEEGRTRAVLSGLEVDWAGWGAHGILALLIEQRIWLVRVP